MVDNNFFEMIRESESGREVTSTNISSSSTHDGILRLKLKKSDGVIKIILHSLAKESSTTPSIEFCNATPKCYYTFSKTYSLVY
jgi:hypothetical protein